MHATLGLGISGARLVFFSGAVSGAWPSWRLVLAHPLPGASQLKNPQHGCSMALYTPASCAPYSGPPYEAGVAAHVSV
jgi:hypothetical protein